MEKNSQKITVDTGIAIILDLRAIFLKARTGFYINRGFAVETDRHVGMCARFLWVVYRMYVCSFFACRREFLIAQNLLKRRHL